MNAKINRAITVVLLVCLFFTLSACRTMQIREYYVEKSNYISALGTVEKITIDERNKTVYIDFSSLTPAFDDTCFKIVGNSFDIVQNNGFESLLKVGDQVKFVTAPKYFGDGYVMPIVAITVNDEDLLSFEDGFVSFLKWFDTDLDE